MFTPRAYTIIVVTFDCVARVDLSVDKSVAVIHSSRMNRPEHAELGDAVRAGFSLGPEKCGRVIVLLDELWSGCVSLSDGIVNAVEADQLEQTLALEAEYESGISPFDSRLGHALAGSIEGQATWWVTQAESSQLDAVSTALPVQAGTVEGIASTNLRSSPSEESDHETLKMKSPAGCDALAQAWLTKYLSDQHGVPVIRMVSQSWTEQRMQRLGRIGTVVALVICAVVYLNDRRQLTNSNAKLSGLLDKTKTLQAELGEAEQSARRITEIKLQQDTSIEAQTQQLNERRRTQARYVAMRHRPVQLLRALAATADPAHWIQNITLNDTRVIISGVAVDSTSVTTLAERLESELDSSKWFVEPAQMSATESTDLVCFDITLVQFDVVSVPFEVAGKGDSYVH